ncbi:unnamed protein product [Spodoptera littoralis]|uniref:Uncharacterized protein n=1 Tax=Spodoptera littoralis TaxID=7109 RepID=A0A9P0I6W9_SPOLI|nr:unnamed protein product [Spodoptera littoralis]CAH1640868.1 unnamed protein product [Spodoptera littoralis]
MDIKLTALFLVVLTLVIHEPVSADFFDRPVISLDEVGKEDSKYKCVPGRTVLKVVEKQEEIVDQSDDSDEYSRSGPSRRIHMSVVSKDETCFMCVCSADGQHEHCSGRPAHTINECILSKNIIDQFNSGIPFKHSRNLPYRIRRVNQNASQMCVPFVSEYSNCNDDNLCSGCSKCTCTRDGQWSCQDVKECPQDFPQDEIPDMDVNKKDNFDMDNDNDVIFDSALDMLEFEMSKKNKHIKTSNNPLVPAPQPVQHKDELLGYLVAIPRQEH